MKSEKLMKTTRGAVGRCGASLAGLSSSKREEKRASQEAGAKEAYS
jgi:hypothetical protein